MSEQKDGHLSKVQLAGVIADYLTGLERRIEERVLARVKGEVRLAVARAALDWHVGSGAGRSTETASSGGAGNEGAGSRSETEGRTGAHEGRSGAVSVCETGATPGAGNAGPACSAVAPPGPPGPIGGDVEVNREAMEKLIARLRSEDCWIAERYWGAGMECETDDPTGAGCGGSDGGNKEKMKKLIAGTLTARKQLPGAAPPPENASECGAVDKNAATERGAVAEAEADVIGGAVDVNVERMERVLRDYEINYGTLWRRDEEMARWLEPLYWEAPPPPLVHYLDNSEIVCSYSVPGDQCAIDIDNVTCQACLDATLKGLGVAVDSETGINPGAEDDSGTDYAPGAVSNSGTAADSGADSRSETERNRGAEDDSETAADTGASMGTGAAILGLRCCRCGVAATKMMAVPGEGVFCSKACFEQLMLEELAAEKLTLEARRMLEKASHQSAVVPDETEKGLGASGSAENNEAADRHGASWRERPPLL